MHRSPSIDRSPTDSRLFYGKKFCYTDYMATDPRSYDDRTSAETRTLLDFVCHTAATDIPTEVLHESARCLLDHLGLAVAGAEEPAARIAKAAVHCAWR